MSKLAPLSQNTPAGALVIRPMVAADALRIERQASQREQLGEERAMTLEEAEELAARGEAYSASRAGRILACFGLTETFPRVQGVAWAILAEGGLGVDHLAITRAARRMVMESPLIRIEAIVRIACPPEIVWAKLCGLTPAHVLRKFGAASEDHLLMERIA